MGLTGNNPKRARAVPTGALRRAGMPAGAAARGVGLLAAPLPRFTSFQRVTPRSYALLQPTGTTYRAPERTATSAAGRSAALPRERPEEHRSGRPALCAPQVKGKRRREPKTPSRPQVSAPRQRSRRAARLRAPPDKAPRPLPAPPRRPEPTCGRGAYSGRPRPQLFPFPAVSTPPPRPAAPHAAAEAAGPLAPQTMGPALTSTTAKRSSSSPGSGMGSLRGTLCALNSVCCESTLPAFPMAAAAAAPPRCCAPRARPLARRAAARHGSPPSPSPRGGLAPAPARRRLPRMPPRGPHKAHSALPARGALGLVVPPPACGREGGEEGARAGAGAGRPDLHLAAPAAGGSAGQLALGGPLPSGLRRDGGGRSTSPPGAAPLCTFKVSTTKR